ncbi:MAG: hypothetical protein FWD86_01930, partial [Firmicutes bacterium]|nr:hypothetical protein [Bacillota bacterium]
MNQKALKTLEYDKILLQVTEYSLVSVSHKFILEITPSSDFDQITKDLNLTEEAYKIYHKLGLRPLIAFDDIAEIAEKTKIMSILQISDIRKIARTIKAATLLKKSILYSPPDITLFKEVVGFLFPDLQLQQDID